VGGVRVTAYGAIGAPAGHRTFTFANGRVRCACGAHFAGRIGLAAHHDLVRMLAAPAVRP
jgi:hypothetical protein